LPANGHSGEPSRQRLGGGGRNGALALELRGMNSAPSKENMRKTDRKAMDIETAQDHDRAPSIGGLRTTRSSAEEIERALGTATGARGHGKVNLDGQLAPRKCPLPCCARRTMEPKWSAGQMFPEQGARSLGLGVGSLPGDGSATRKQFFGSAARDADPRCQLLAVGGGGGD